MTGADVTVEVAADWRPVKRTRLRALADAPYAFASTLAREALFDDTRWNERVEEGRWFLAWLRGRPIGIAALRPDEDDREAMRLASMWVEPEQRGGRAAELLLDAVIERALSEGAHRLTLWVPASTPRARRFYEKLGFAATGRRQPLPSAVEVQEEQLARPLR